MVFLLTLPSSVGLIVLGRTMIGAIYQGGKFSAYDTEQTALALSCYAWAWPDTPRSKCLNPAFYALHDARTPMLISLLSIAVNYFTASLLLRHTGLGHAGLALSTAAVATFGGSRAVRDSAQTHRRHLWPQSDRERLENHAASAVMGAAVLLSSHGIEGWLGVSRWGA
jgi:putative peptidoglycan lipid II flippase